MLPSVCREDSLEPETFAAELAREGHGSGMDPVVLLQGTPLPELPSAHVALVWLQAGVDRSVLPQTHQRLKRLSAHVAIKRSRCRVRQQVIIKISLLDETFATLIARIVPDSGVDPLVSHEIRFGSKFFRALVALVSVF